VTASGFDALAICGPTASGKSEAALLVAEALDGEIVNADARQVYRYMPVGTGMPSRAAMRRVPHHLFAFVDPCARYSAGAYVGDALAAIENIAARGRLPIVVGGTGFYIDVLRGAMPLDRPFGDDDVRARVRSEAAIHPHEALREWLSVLSPARARDVAAGDRYRTLRMLESVIASRGLTGAARRKGAGRTARLKIVVLDIDRDELACRIGRRANAMFDGGLIDEAVAVWRRCPEAPALSGLGYAEALAWHRGEARRDEAVRLTTLRTCRYAKRQRTWFRRMRDAMVVSEADPHAAAAAAAAYAREKQPST
jgi:tRNA dimethylallyltransferase